jgi:hypothetical protein
MFSTDRTIDAPDGLPAMPHLGPMPASRRMDAN